MPILFPQKQYIVSLLLLVRFFIFSCQKFHNYASQHEFLWVYPVQNLLSLLNLQVYDLCHTWENFSHYFFEFFLAFPYGIQITQTLEIFFQFLGLFIFIQSSFFFVKSDSFLSFCYKVQQFFSLSTLLLCTCNYFLKKFYFRITQIYRKVKRMERILVYLAPNFLHCYRLKLPQQFSHVISEIPMAVFS